MSILKVKGAWAIIVECVDVIVQALSTKKYGHPVGNLTVSDISEHLIRECGMDGPVSRQLAQGAYRRHEVWRFTADAKTLRIEYEHSLTETADKSIDASTDK